MDKVPGFILKLWKIINDPRSDDLIAWSDNGQSFIILNPPRFSQELSKYFKHNNLSSFIRQLNMYGFKKVAAIENQEDLHFYHPDFVRGDPDRLEAIKRKLPQRATESVDYRNIVQGLTELEHKQKDVAQSLSDIKRENEMLWAQLHDLRQKHQQQELYIGRLMKLVFNVMEQNGIRANTIQFESPLAIEQGATSQLSPPPLVATTAVSQLTAPSSSTIVIQQPQHHQIVEAAAANAAIIRSDTPLLTQQVVDAAMPQVVDNTTTDQEYENLPQPTFMETSDNLDSLIKNFEEGEPLIDYDGGNFD